MREAVLSWMVTGLLPIAALAAAPAAQSGRTVCDRVRDTMLADEVGWKLEWTGVEEHQCTQRWARGAALILITYDEQTTEADAAAWLDAIPSRVSIAGKPLPDVGDGAWIFTCVSATVYLRRGRGTAMVSAPSANIGTRIAKLVAAQIY
jgi:hypothetical protein